MKDFGVIVICCNSDYWSAKACCASIRYFMGDIPICLLVDGTFKVDDLKKTYGVHILNRTNISNPVLREKSFGWGLTRMIAFWESPFEYFLILDADTIVWGDMTKYADFDKYDLIIDKPKQSYSCEDINKWFFDTSKICSYFPDFQWQNRSYVCHAVLFSRKYIWDLNEYIQILDLRAKEPEMFFYGDMGFINFMMFSGSDKGDFRLDQADIQIIVQDYNQDELKNHFPLENLDNNLTPKETKVIHYAGIKALLSNQNFYIDPMTFFRKKFLKDAYNLNNFFCDLYLKSEEYILRHPKVAKAIKYLEDSK